MLMVKVKEDLTGQIFGRWLVLKQAEDYITPKTGKHQAMWLCECLCDEHTKKIISGNNLKSHKSQSCGCLFRENLIQFNKETKKKYNKYDYSKEYGVGYCSNTGNEFYFDWEDFDKIKDYCWNEHIKKNGYHVLETYCKQQDKNIPMMHLFGYKRYDHENRNPLDNRKANLRKATQQENVRNKSIQKNNTSGVTGVGYLSNTGSWRARITYNEKSIYLGTFKNKDEAIKARLMAEKKYFGEFAPQRHLFEQYEI